MSRYLDLMVNVIREAKLWHFHKLPETGEYHQCVCNVPDCVTLMLLDEMNSIIDAG